MCLDETSTQLLGEVRELLPAQPGRPRRQDYEYRCGGTRKPLPVLRTAGRLAPRGHHPTTYHGGTSAHQMRWLVDTAYSDAPVIRVVQDNPVSSTGQALNTHRMASLYETFPRR